MDAIDVHELSKWYGQRAAVDQISFKIKEGQVFGLLGPNGAGKTTTIKMLTTLLPISTGIAKIKGFDVKRQSHQVRKVIGYVPQGSSSDKDLSGYENLLLSARLFGINKKAIAQIIDFVGLQGYEDLVAGRYSGGTLRKLEIAQALLHRPSVLFVDEPSVGLDPVSRKMLWDLFASLRKKWKMTIFLSTHDLQEAETLCDMVGILQDGKLIVIDSVENLKRQIGEKATLGEVYFKHARI